MLHRRLNSTQKLALLTAAMTALAGPIAVGLLRASQSSQAATQSMKGTPLLLAVAAKEMASPSQARLSPEFDAASIKPFSGGGRSGPVQFGPGRAFATSVTAFRMILAAYHLREDQLSGGPGWLESYKFVLDAKKENCLDETQLRLMVQTLLAKRFQLVVHPETKAEPVYALTVGKNGTKLREWKKGDPVPSLDRSRGAGGIVNMEKMDDFVAFLNLRGIAQTYGIGRPVLDETGLNGTYLFSFWWQTNDDSMAAVEEQLGLKFEKRRASVEILVIDHIDKPSEN